MREPDAELDQLAAEVVDAALEVHKILGPGFLESTYEEALCIELELRGVAFERQKPVALRYKGRPVGDARLDLLVGERLVVELKATEALHPIHHAKVINYLKATELELGLLINFHVVLLKDGIKRVVLT
ncbi:hypothetical protein Pla123a_33910 [Posidoniimonas polymericola]|uniref:GxxExxY protein n=1 Tax=Posidoniimonas polymericola TaxID=2528002 RepID=A0A5C5YI76_9BACT|nr:GxxExxY protein [Posidoniimonas polymericola]TWT74567.1 hypothetical protein Pla123a_33910 [Posidoniimonas polymericola]